MTRSPPGNVSTKVVVEFADRDLRLITASLRDVIDQRRLDLPPRILRDWGRTDLRLKPEPLEKRREGHQRVALVEKRAELLNEALAVIDDADRLNIITQWPAGRSEFLKG